MVRYSHHSLFLYKTLLKSRIIKTFEMDRTKLQWRLRILILLQPMHRIKRPNQKKKKRCWVRDIFKNRERQCAFETWFHEMRNDRELFLGYFLMSPERSDHLLTLVRDQIEKKDTAFRKSFLAAGRLAINKLLVSLFSMTIYMFSSFLTRCSYCVLWFNFKIQEKEKING